MNDKVTQPVVEPVSDRLRAMTAAMRKMAAELEEERLGHATLDQQREELARQRKELRENDAEAAAYSLRDEGYYVILRLTGQLWSCELRNFTLGIWPYGNGNTAIEAIREAVRSRDYMIGKQLEISK